VVAYGGGVRGAGLSRVALLRGGSVGWGRAAWSDVAIVKPVLGAWDPVGTGLCARWLWVLPCACVGDARRAACGTGLRRARSVRNGVVGAGRAACGTCVVALPALGDRNPVGAGPRACRPWAVVAASGGCGRGVARGAWLGARAWLCARLLLGAGTVSWCRGWGQGRGRRWGLGWSWTGVGSGGRWLRWQAELHVEMEHACTKHANGDDKKQTGQDKGNEHIEDRKESKDKEAGKRRGTAHERKVHQVNQKKGKG
jgi:hypothetical protein